MDEFDETIALLCRVPGGREVLDHVRSADVRQISTVRALSDRTGHSMAMKGG